MDFSRAEEMIEKWLPWICQCLRINRPVVNLVGYSTPRPAAFNSVQGRVVVGVAELPNVIYIMPSRCLNEKYFIYTLAHECCHIWQFQTWTSEEITNVENMERVAHKFANDYVERIRFHAEQPQYTHQDASPLWYVLIGWWLGSR